MNIMNLTMKMHNNTILISLERAVFFYERYIMKLCVLDKTLAQRRKIFDRCDR